MLGNAEAEMDREAATGCCAETNEAVVDLEKRENEARSMAAIYSSLLCTLGEMASFFLKARTDFVV